MRMARHRPPALNESRQQSADADELDVQPALICERGSGVEVCPWGSQQVVLEAGTSRFEWRVANSSNIMAFII